VAHRQPKRKTHNHTSLLRLAMALSRELLQEPVASGHADLAQGQVLEGRHHEPAHVAFIELSGGQGEPILQFDVLKPVVHERREPAVRRQHRRARLEQGPLRQLCLQRSFGRSLRAPARRDQSSDTVPIPVASTRYRSSRSRRGEVNLSEGPDGSTWPTHGADSRFGVTVRGATIAETKTRPSSLSTLRHALFAWTAGRARSGTRIDDVAVVSPRSGIPRSGIPRSGIMDSAMNVRSE